MEEQRKLHGVNLTGWLMLEPWVTPELFAGTGSLSEDALIESIGEDLYADLVAEHRNSFITEQDFEQIASRGLNAVRLPVPWYAFGDTGPAPGPYLGCVTQIDNALTWAETYHIDVILSLAINPGDQGQEDLLAPGERGQRENMLTVIAALAKRYRDWPAFFGLEVANEPVVQQHKGFLGLRITEGTPIHLLRNYYRDAYTAVRDEAGERPVVVIPDAGLPGEWRSFMAPKHYHNVWLDCHLFHHSDHIDATGPSGTRSMVRASRSVLEQASRCGFPVMVGAWSAALPYADSVMTPEGRIALERMFVADQITVFKECPAWFFQAWKTSGRISGWDSRIALSSFERRMLD